MRALRWHPLTRVASPPGPPTWVRGIGLLGLLLLSHGCSEPRDLSPNGAEAPQGAEALATITDDAGRRHSFDSPPQRIVSLVPSITEMLVALDIPGELVGRTDFDSEPAVLSLPSVGGGLQPDLEILIALDPDLVIRFAAASDIETPARLDELGIPHFAVLPESISDVRSILERLGRVFNRTPAADSIVSEIDRRLAVVAAESVGAPSIRVAFHLGGSTPYVAGPGTYIHELIEHAGGVNVFDDLQALYAEVSLEEFLVREIDLLLIAEGGQAPQRLEHIPVLTLPESLLFPGPRVSDAAEAVAAALQMIRRR